MSKLLTVLIPFLFQAPVALAAVTKVEIEASAVNAEAVQKTGKHLAYWDDSVASADLLLVSFGGTHSRPSDFGALDNLAASKGFDVIAVDYFNGIISTTCATIADPLCFDKFREENMHGVDVSDLIDVTPADSIESRISDLLRYLSQLNPERWGKYLDRGQVRWNKIVSIGHSQGSGHAAYLGHIHSLHGVLMFAGPQDRFTSTTGCTSEEGRLANWVLQPHKTSPDRFYSFSHINDCFGSASQVKAIKEFSKGQRLEEHLVLTDMPNVDGHMIVINPVFLDVWDRLLSQQLKKK